MTNLENRVEKLEDFVSKTKECLARIETRLENVERIISTTMATKADLTSLESRLETKMANLETRLIKWFVGTAITLTGLAFAAARFIPN